MPAVRRHHAVPNWPRRCRRDMRSPRLRAAVMLTPAVVQATALSPHNHADEQKTAQTRADALLDPVALLVTPGKPDGLPKARDLL